MPCYHPLRAVLSNGPEGKRSLSFSGPVLELGSARGKGISIPCGRCIGCRLERARQWAVRILHESKMHDENSFLTLTYEKMPDGGTLVKRDLQLFFKKFRKVIEHLRCHHDSDRCVPTRIKFFACGEYGENLGRPHYHAIVFGWFPTDAVLIKRSGDLSLYSSSLLSSTWGHGFASVGSVSFDSACYVANYATKKVIGPQAVAHYKGRVPEFLLMSRGGRKKGGIGRSWIETNAIDVYNHDSCIIRGVESRPPRYYDGVAEGLGLDIGSIKLSRETKAQKIEEYVTGLGSKILVSESRNDHRLAVREIVAKAKLSQKNRNMEKSNA